MLQIDHIYEFFYSTFKNIDIHYFNRGVIEDSHYHVFNGAQNKPKILFYDQEPLVPTLANFYLEVFKSTTATQTDPQQIIQNIKNGNTVPNGIQEAVVVTSEKSQLIDQLCEKYNIKQLYYFYHGYAALDWYRGFYALNYNKQVIKEYQYDYVTFNRLITNDRSYRCYFISKLIEHNLIDKGMVSFGLTNEQGTWQEEIQSIESKLSNNAKNHIIENVSQIHTPLVIDSEDIQGWASADIPRCINDSFWHIVTETVFYYDKLHLTEKIFKPIVMKQPFMLLAAPGNLAYLKSYGFKTFEGIIDEGYDLIKDPDLRIDAVVEQLQWYCNLSESDKKAVIIAVNDIVEYNFHHFYGNFRHIITQELITNTKSLLKEIGYDDSYISWNNTYTVLTT